MVGRTCRFYGFFLAEYENYKSLVVLVVVVASHMNTLSGHYFKPLSHYEQKEILLQVEMTMVDLLYKQRFYYFCWLNYVKCKRNLLRHIALRDIDPSVIGLILELQLLHISLYLRSLENYFVYELFGVQRTLSKVEGFFNQNCR